MRAGADPAQSVGEPRLVRDASPELGVALGTLWLAVVRAGGAVSFRADDPEDDIRRAGHAQVEDVRTGGQDLIVLDAADRAGALAGTVFLKRGAGSPFRHRAEIHRLMVRPDLQGRGLGTRLLDAAVAHGTEIGLEQILLAVRGGTWMLDFYRDRGWTEVGVWPGALVIAPGEVRDQHWFQLRLRRS